MVQLKHYAEHKPPSHLAFPTHALLQPWTTSQQSRRWSTCYSYLAVSSCMEILNRPDPCLTYDFHCVT